MELLAEKMYSNHPADKHLTVVLVKRGEKDYVCWLRNSAPKCEGDSLGKYFTDIDEAEKCFKERHYDAFQNFRVLFERENTFS
jgi:hypothetical protein